MKSSEYSPDVTDMPGYWDTVVDSPPERKRWYLFTHPPNIDVIGAEPHRLQERGLQERWWGTFTNWLSKMNQVEKDASVSRNFHWSDTVRMFQFATQAHFSLSGRSSIRRFPVLVYHDCMFP
jgi:hypothetical protein